MTATPSISPLASWLIGLYQRHLSPRKGFRCAYRARHPARSSCSEFGKRAIERLGMLSGVQLLRRRFRRCHAASEVCRNQAKPRRQSEYFDRLGACANPSQPLETEALCCAAEVGAEGCCALIT
jgi:putative component of membrane protein insertase Oxa1/YidC/SpoIIIJ protein YidD